MTAWDTLRSSFPTNTDGLITAETMRDQVTSLETIDADNMKGASVQHIFKTPGDSLDISGEVSAITDATTTKRYVITLNAGQYTTLPVGMKEYVYVQGEPGVVVAPNAVTDTVFTMSNESTLEGLTIDGASSGIGISWTGTGQCDIKDVFLKDCAVGLKIDCTGGCNTSNVKIGGTLTTGILIEGGTAILNFPFCGTSSTVTTFIRVDSADAKAIIRGALSMATGVTYGLSFTGGCHVHMDNPTISYATYGLSVTGSTTLTIKGGIFEACDYGGYIPVDAGSPQIEFSGTTAMDSVYYDLYWLNSNANIIGLGTADVSSSVIAEGTSAHGLIVDITEGDEGIQILGELKVGTPLMPSESCFGEGDSYASVNTNKYYTWNGSVYADVTADLASPSSSLESFPNHLVDSALYLCSTVEKDGDYLKIPGFKTNVTTAATHGETSSPFVVEYWSGSAWVETTIMETDSSDSYESHSNTLFESTGSHQVRFSALLPDATWAKSDPMSFGTAYYWIRIRLTAALIIVPIFEQIKTHSNRTEINDDGFMEFFGKGRPFRALSWDSGLLTGTGVSPDGTHLYVSDSLDRLLIGNIFGNGDDDRVGFNTYLPYDCDTSTPIRLIMSFVSTDASATDAEFTVRWGHTADGDSVYDSAADAPTTGGNEQSATMTVTMPATADTQVTGSVDLDISDLVVTRTVGSADILWVSIERPTGDTHSGDISLINVQPLYSAHVLGGHV